MRHGRRAIVAVSELERELGNEFVLFVGSAISGVSEPYLAMVNVKSEVLTAVATRFDLDTYLGALYSEYSRSFVQNETYGKLLKDTKFEEFLSLLRRSSSRDRLDDLLMGLYGCDKGEFGPNHLAIAYLFRSGKCLTCLTTNFDNAIERACESIGLQIDVKVKSGDYPADLPSRPERPLLLNYTATR